MFAKIKKWLVASPDGKRSTHYLEVFGGTFAVAAIASAEHVASLHQPFTWSVVLAAAAAGAKAVIDIARPIVVGWFTKKSLG